MGALECLPLSTPPEDKNEQTHRSNNKAKVIHVLQGDGQEDWKAEQHRKYKHPNGGEDVTDRTKDWSEVKLSLWQDFVSTSNDNHRLRYSVCNVQT